MLVNEVCKECNLTKKAVEYYIEQGLIAPSVRENGYRDFCDADVARLKKISVLRTGTVGGRDRGCFDKAGSVVK